MPDRNIRITLAYDGTRFVGWQRQAEGESIQGLLEGALARFEGSPVTVDGAGRTDAGVHALGQVASARVTFAHDAPTLVRALNAQLPPDVRVLRVEDAPDRFHARFSATRKTYRYLISNDAVPSPFQRAYAWHLVDRLDLAAMQRGAAMLVGTHDFAAFRSTGTSARTTVRTITRSDILVCRANDVLAPDSSFIAYEVTGDGFLRHMVRAVVGTLVEIGRGWRTPDSMAQLLAGAARAAAGATAPPRGLFLVRVDYD